MKVFPLFCSRQSTGEEGQRNFTSQIRTSSIASNHPSRQNELDNKRRDVCSCNLRRLWNNNLEEREERSGNQRAGPPLSKVRNDFFFFFTTKREEEKRKRKKAEECTRQDEGGQARVTRWIEYLRGTPFAWKIERCSSIKVALHEKKNNELEKKEFVFVPYEFSFPLPFYWIFLTSVSRIVLAKINNFRKIKTTLVTDLNLYTFERNKCKSSILGNLSFDESCKICFRISRMIKTNVERNTKICILVHYALICVRYKGHRIWRRY